MARRSRRALHSVVPVALSFKTEARDHGDRVQQANQMGERVALMAVP